MGPKCVLIFVDTFCTGGKYRVVLYNMYSLRYGINGGASSLITLTTTPKAWCTRELAAELTGERDGSSANSSRALLFTCGFCPASNNLM